MNHTPSTIRADRALRRAHADFEHAAAGRRRRAPIIAAVVGLLGAAGALTRFAVDVTLDADHTDPIHLTPRILETV